MKPDKFKVKIESAFPGASVNVVDTMGDNDHYHVEISSAEFNDLTLVAQHRLFNERLAMCVKEIHAISLKTSKP